MLNFVDLISARDFDRLRHLFAEDVTLFSPVVRDPARGRDVAITVLKKVMSTIENIEYVRSFDELDGGQAFLFHSRVGGREFMGADFIRYNDAGEIAELVVMIRPTLVADDTGAGVRQQFTDIHSDHHS